MKVMYFFLPILLFTGCDVLPVTPSLPPETQEGAGTFGALVDGVVWRPNNGGQFFPLALAASYGSGSLIVEAANRPIDASIRFALYDTIYAEGTYFLAKSKTPLFYVAYEKDNIHYFPNADNYGTLVVTKLDTLNLGFVSGTFEFEAISEIDSTDTVRITDGRFDVRF
ncbi:MAG: DUF6252 family protein [Bacteroidia bacterium]